MDLEAHLTRCRPRVNKVCASLLRNRPDLASHRQDVISDGVEIAMNMIVNGDIDPDEFERTLWKDLQRRVRKYAPRWEESLPDDLYENIPDDSRDVADIVNSKMVRDALNLCILRLPETQRKAIILYYYCGLTQTEAASRIGIRQAGFSRRLDRARKRIVDDLTEMGFPPSR